MTWFIQVRLPAGYRKRSVSAVTDIFVPPGMQTFSKTSGDLRQVRNVSLATPGIVKNFARATRHRVKSFHPNAGLFANQKIRRTENRMGQLV